MLYQAIYFSNSIHCRRRCEVINAIKQCYAYDIEIKSDETLISMPSFFLNPSEYLISGISAHITSNLTSQNRCSAPGEMVSVPSKVRSKLGGWSSSSSHAHQSYCISHILVYLISSHSGWYHRHNPHNLHTNIYVYLLIVVCVRTASFWKRTNK